MLLKTLSALFLCATLTTSSIQTDFEPFSLAKNEALVGKKAPSKPKELEAIEALIEPIMQLKSKIENHIPQKQLFVIKQQVIKIALIVRRYL